MTHRFNSACHEVDGVQVRLLRRQRLLRQQVGEERRLLFRVARAHPEHPLAMNGVQFLRACDTLSISMAWMHGGDITRGDACSKNLAEF